jgi:hypothetical protein
MDQEDHVMRTNQPNVYAMPQIKHKPRPAAATPPRTQRELVKASLLARPTRSPTTKA